MKKAVSILLAVILSVLTVTATVNAQIINRSAMKTTEEAVAEAEAASGEPIKTNRIYFKMPDLDTWYSDYSVYEGRYYASIYWWNGSAVPEEYPGFRASVDDYEQGVYYAEVPDDVSAVIWGNGYSALEPERFTPKYEDMTFTWDINIEGALDGEYDSLPEGSPDPYSFDGCIFVIDPSLSETSGRKYYYGDWYVYYGGGCYGSYADTSESFTSVEDNCLNPDHFDADGNHVGGAHIQAPAAPDHAPVDTEPDSAINGYYFVSSSEPGVVRSENKLYKTSVDREYYGYRHIYAGYSFRIVHYMDGVALDESAWYPEQGWYNENGAIDDTPSGSGYNVFFRPDGDGDSSFTDGRLKVVPAGDEHPTEAATAAPTEPPKPTSVYKERIEGYCADHWGADITGYNELYHHKGTDGGTDWVLIRAFTNMMYPETLNTIIGNRVIISSGCGVPFDSGYGIYDVKNDDFIDAVSYKAKDYDDFCTVFDELGGGRLLGDLDGDNELSVIDVTLIQRCQAMMRDYPADDEIMLMNEAVWHSSVRYYSDFDRNGDRDITDATFLQRYLVGLG